MPSPLRRASRRRNNRSYRRQQTPTHRRRPKTKSPARAQDVLFRVRFHYRWLTIIGAGVVAAGAVAFAQSAATAPNDDLAVTSGAIGDPVTNDSAPERLTSDSAPSTDLSQPNPTSHLHADERIIVIERPNGLQLAIEGRTVEVVAISGVSGPIVATPLTGEARVVARTETTASLIVTEREALEILESQAFGSIAFLATNPDPDT